jgi:hypothetical protein
MVVGVLGVSANASAVTKTVTITPSSTEKAFTVPAGVSEVKVEAVAESGQSGCSAFEGTAGPGGSGAKLTATLSASPGEKLDVQFGGGGEAGAGEKCPGGHGGGASDLLTESSTPLVVAGGGGGGGAGCCEETGGKGGSAEPPGLAGGTGANGTGAAGDGGGGGTGGGEAAGGQGGVAGIGFGCESGTKGELGNGGRGGGPGTLHRCEGGGGGGGGYNGGGGGGSGLATGGGGGAGSSYISSARKVGPSGIEVNQGTEPQVVITYTVCGKTTVGKSSDALLPNLKRVNKCVLPNVRVSELTDYVAPTSSKGQQLIKGVIYADSKGTPGALMGVTEQLTFKSTNSAGWYHLAFSPPVKLSAGTYWIGLITGATSKVASERYDAVKNAEDYNANSYTTGPSNPFGSFKTTNEEMSIYATYTTEQPG